MSLQVGVPELTVVKLSKSSGRGQREAQRCDRPHKNNKRTSTVTTFNRP
jgi:hypothetical protein